MNVYIEEFITATGFLNFQIGRKIDLKPYTQGLNYNVIGSEENAPAYYFFDQEIDFEVYEKEGITYSIDILLKNQGNNLFLGEKNSSCFKLNNCRMDDLLHFLNSREMFWKFNSILSPKDLSITFFKELQFDLYFDFNNAASESLSLISIRKIMK